MLGLRPGTQGEMAPNQSHLTTSRYNNSPIHFILLWYIYVFSFALLCCAVSERPVSFGITVDLKEFRLVRNFVGLCTNKPQGCREPSARYCCARVWFSSAQVMGEPRWGNHSCMHFSSHLILYIVFSSGFAFSFPSHRLWFIAPRMRLCYSLPFTLSSRISVCFFLVNKFLGCLCAALMQSFFFFCSPTVGERTLLKIWVLLWSVNSFYYLSTSYMHCILADF